MKLSLKIILRSLGIMAVIAIAIIFAVRSKHQRGDNICRDIKVEILDKSKLKFVTEADVKRYIAEGYGTFVGERQDSVNLVEIEYAVGTGSAVKTCEAYVSFDGILHVQVTQREPVMRFQVREGGFYVDEMGNLFPLQANYTSRVPIVDGELPFRAPTGFKGAPENAADKDWMLGMTRFAKFLGNNKFWSNAISQITVGSDREITLIPCKAKERILFGTPDDIEQKFARIEKYYRYIEPARKEKMETEGKLKPYKTVDVRFDGQIVCR